jgi:type I restriction enzyme S subunit
MVTTKIKLGDVLDVKRGASLSGDYYAKTGTLIRLTLGNFNYPGGGFKDNTAKDDIYYTGKVRGEFILKKGEIITPLTEQVRGLLGETARIPFSDLYIQSQDVGKIIPNEKKLDRNFAYYLISSPIIKYQLDAGAQQTKIRHTSPDKIKDCVAWIPDIHDQKKIANLLDFLNAKISCNNKINAELGLMTKALYDYWFLQFEFPNEEGKPYNSSGGKLVWNEGIKRKIPEGWDARQIGDILIEADKSKIQVNGAKEKGEFPFFTSGESILAYHEYIVDGFNILLNTGGNPDIKAYKGKCAYSTDTWCISAKQYSYILYHHLLKLMPQFEQLFFAGSGLKHLQKDALKSKYILLPNNKVLNAFNVYCSSIWEKITNCLIQNLELSSLRDFLLPLLMNGQVTLK